MSLLKKLKIGSLILKNNVFLAPLAGIGEASFRILAKRFGAGLTFTGMVSSYGIIKGNKNTLDLLKITTEERPVGIQIFGSNPEIMGNAAFQLSRFPVDLIDINGGCSVRKVLKSGSGARILLDPSEFFKIVKACVENSSYPVSVKIRLGLKEEKINVLENALAAQEAGASLLTLHPRTAEDNFRICARWEYIGLVKQTLKIPVCGNGDIKTPEDAVRMMVETGCDAVMIGRSAIGNPWILGQTIRTFEAYPERVNMNPPSNEERIHLALEHLASMCLKKGEVRGTREVKKHLFRYVKGIHNGSKVRKILMETEKQREAVQTLTSLL